MNDCANCSILFLMNFDYYPFCPDEYVVAFFQCLLLFLGFVLNKCKIEIPDEKDLFTTDSQPTHERTHTPEREGGREY
jgi:hypothetical protein